MTGTPADRPAFAAQIMVLSLFALGLQDSVVKMTSDTVSLWQFQMLRAAFNLIFLIIISRVFWGSRIPKPNRLWAIALRSILLVGAMVFFFGGIPFLNLTEIAAGLYVFPLFVAILSAVVLGERVGPRRIIAILIGFSGTLLILKPGTDAFKPVGLMPVVAALCYAITILTTRRLCRTESPVTLTAGAGICFMIVGGIGLLVLPGDGSGAVATPWPYLFSGWHAISPYTVGLIVSCSVLNLAANIGLAKAYQSAEASWLAPFDYSYLIFATFWGFVFWAHIPDGWTFAGMAMIAGSGSFVAWQEKRTRDRVNVL